VAIHRHARQTYCAAPHKSGKPTRARIICRTSSGSVRLCKLRLEERRLRISVNLGALIDSCADSKLSEPRGLNEAETDALLYDVAAVCISVSDALVSLRATPCASRIDNEGSGEVNAFTHLSSCNFLVFRSVSKMLEGESGRAK
jgi:hypothetical protein